MKRTFRGRHLTTEEIARDKEIRQKVREEFPPARDKEFMMSTTIQNEDSSTETIEQRFQRLAAEWNRATGHLSSMSRAAAHPAYQEIIAMGEEVVPLLLRDMERTHQHWFYALKAITGAQPVPREIAGKVPEMVNVWLDWARNQGIKW